MTKQDLIDALNADLANEYAAIIQYITYASKVKGQFRPKLTEFLMAEVADEQIHAKFLADKIVTLGGEPTTQVAAVPVVESTKEMIEEIRKAEQRAIEGYTQRAEQANALGLKALALDLEDMIRDETNHMEEVSKILEGWI